MTADTFTEAARAEAERRWPRGQADDHPLPGHARMSRRIGFEIGALWALAQEPTDAERAVRELHAPHVEVVPGGAGSARTFTVCAECWRTHDVSETALYPCATIQALDSARAARRDEEKRDG